jgi:hypothetical protein
MGGVGGTPICATIGDVKIVSHPAMAAASTEPV